MCIDNNQPFEYRAEDQDESLTVEFTHVTVFTGNGMWVDTGTQVGSGKSVDEAWAQVHSKQVDFHNGYDASFDDWKAV